MPQRVPRLSIGLPVYNGENYLAEAVKSLLDQSFEDFELIISDNASTDRTSEIARDYAARDARIRYTRSDVNRGGAWNFNRVFELSESEYFKWAAHDDLCHPDLLKRCVEKLDRRPELVLCFSRSMIIDDRGQHLYPYENHCQANSPRPCERFRDTLTNLRLCHMQFGVLRASAVRRTRLYGTYQASDTVLLSELALRGEFHELPEVLFYRRDHPQRPGLDPRSAAAVLAAWYDPANEGKLQMLHWKWLSRYLGSITRVPIGLGDKIRCYALMARWMTWNWEPLKTELRLAARALWRRRGPA